MNRNARAWVFWIFAAAILAMVARNPLYTILLLLVSRIIVVADSSPGDELKIPLLRIAVAILLFSATYNALFVHVGETVLITLPDWPLIGGPVTLEALVAGVANGLVLLTLLSIFLALNAIVPVGDLVRLTPSALQDLGVVVLIAITYVPETRRHLKRIQEAQAIRGHQLRGINDWRPLVVPLLVGGLERAMHLAETMVARGYGATTSMAPTTGERIGLTAGLVVVFSGWLVALWQGWPGWILLGAGLLLLAGVLWRRSYRAPRTTYRPAVWGPKELLLLATASIALVVVIVPWPIVDQATLAYSPFPKLSVPDFDWIIGAALAALALPALVK